jgi:hypothetical protein
MPDSELHQRNEPMRRAVTRPAGGRPGNVWTSTSPLEMDASQDPGVDVRPAGGDPTRAAPEPTDAHSGRRGHHVGRRTGGRQLAYVLQKQAERFGVPGDELLIPSDPPPGPVNDVPPRGDGRDRFNSGTGKTHHVPIPGILGESDKPEIFDRQPDDEQTGDTRDTMVSAAPTKPPARRLPRAWGDVPPRKPNFTGRKEPSSQLHDELLTVREAAVLPQTLHGMGGVGKSRLAIEYVHRHSSEYDLVWWISAEQNSPVLPPLVELARRLGLDVSPDADSTLPAVQDALNIGILGYARWLLVSDNAKSIDEVRLCFPNGGAGKALVTSRNREGTAASRALEVDVFTRGESNAFLTNRAPEPTDNDAHWLAEAVGDLPLAVEPAASWRAATGLPVNEYLELKHPVLGYLELMTAENIELLDDIVFRVCSFFFPEAISREFLPGLGRTTDHRPPRPDATRLRDARPVDPRHSALRPSRAEPNHQSDTLHIHRLIQTLIVGRTDGSQRDLMRAGVYTLLAGANPHSRGRHSRWGVYPVAPSARTGVRRGRVDRSERDELSMKTIELHPRHRDRSRHIGPPAPRHPA